MPKNIHNITDFSGGINKDLDPRDISDTEAVDSDGFLSIHKGKLTTAGGFVRPNSMNNQTLGFPGDNNAEGVANLYYVNPSYGFKKTGFGSVTIDGTEVQISTSYPHSLSIGETITVYAYEGSTYDWKGEVLTVITITSKVAFKSHINSGSGFANATKIYWAINATYDSNAEYSHRAIKPNRNFNDRYIFRAYRNSRFGFFKLTQNNTWFGYGDDNSSHGTPSNNALGQDSWYFDLNYLWNTFQNNDKGADIDLIKIHDVFYDNGAMRLIPEAPEKWSFDKCIRPVGLYYIEDKINFYNDITHGYKINSGWYSLRTHCFSPEDYRVNTLSNKDSFNKVGGKLGVDTDAANLSTFEGSTDILTNAHKINITIGHGNNGLEGDWQFSSGAEHSKVGLGISFIYDDIENGQNSRISLLTADGTSTGNNYVDMTGDSANNNESLYIYWKLHRGNTVSSNLLNNHFKYSSAEAVAIDEIRGTNINDGYGNFDAWNPRIVGANIWVTYTNDGPVDDPLLLTTINFASDRDRYGVSKSHDDVEASEWTAATGDTSCSDQVILGIPTVPVISYRMLNGVKKDENTFIWYKTSAIVNRRLYAGNVSYFLNNDPQLLSANEPPVHKPDRIIRSAVNKLDILSPNNFLEIMRDDGQDIVKLLAFKSELLVFKNDDLIIIDCASEFEFIKDTKYNLGISNPLHAITSDKYIFWINEGGIHAYDGNEYYNLIKDKISFKDWRNNIFNSDSKIVFDSEKGWLLVVVKYDDEIYSSGANADKLLVIDIADGSIFFKSTISNVPSERYSQPINVGRDIYIANTSLGGEVFTSTMEVGNEGSPAIGYAGFGFDENTHSNGTYYGPYMPNADASYVYLSTDTGYVLLNDASWVDPFGSATQPTNVSPAQININGINHANRLNALILEKAGNYGVTCQWNEMAKKFYFFIEGKTNSSSNNLNPVNIPGYSEFSNTGRTFVIFSSTATTAGFNTANINSGSVQFNGDGVANTANTYRLHPNRIDNTVSGISYSIEIRNYLLDTREIFTYTTGNTGNYWHVGETVKGEGFADETDTGASQATIRDRLTRNILRWLNDPRNHSQSQNAILSNSFEIPFPNESGSSGSKYIDIVALNQHYSNTLEVLTTTHALTQTGLGSTLLKWEMNPLLNRNDIYTFFNSRVLYESKSLTFFTPKQTETAVQDSGPNVRKKIYKMYLTYTGGNNNINIYYRVNDASSWSNAVVKDAVITEGLSVVQNRLSHADNQTRQEITFGSDSSSVYSFQFKIESIAPVAFFEINDISIVYRNKRVK